jgi:hypothetical protein
MKKKIFKILIIKKMSKVKEAIDWIKEQGVKKLLNKEGEKEILCLCKWLDLWSNDTLWNDIINDYTCIISKEEHQEIICEVGLTETIKYMVNDCDGVSFFYPRHSDTNYEGLLCDYALQIKVRDSLDEMYDYYKDEIDEFDINDIECECE